jgi:hypothetical protein
MRDDKQHVVSAGDPRTETSQQGRHLSCRRENAETARYRKTKRRKIVPQTTTQKKAITCWSKGIAGTMTELAGGKLVTQCDCMSQIQGPTLCIVRISTVLALVLLSRRSHFEVTSLRFENM